MILDPVDEAIFGSAASVLSTLLEPVQKMNFYPWEGKGFLITTVNSFRLLKIMKHIDKHFDENSTL